MAPEDVTTITEGKVLVTRRGNVLVVPTSDGPDGPKNKKKQATKSAAAKSRRRKLKANRQVPILIKDENFMQPEMEIKQELDDKVAHMKKHKSVVSEGHKEVRSKIKTSKTVRDENSARKRALAADDSCIKVESAEAEEVVEIKRSTKSARLKKLVQPVSQNFAVMPQPPKKKRKV